MKDISASIRELGKLMSGRHTMPPLTWTIESDDEGSIAVGRDADGAARAYMHPDDAVAHGLMKLGAREP